MKQQFDFDSIYVGCVLHNHAKIYNRMADYFESIGRPKMAKMCRLMTKNNINKINNMKQELKKGDVLICVDNSATHLTNLSRYEYIRTERKYANGTIMIKVRLLDNNEVQSSLYNLERFILETEFIATCNSIV